MFEKNDTKYELASDDVFEKTKRRNNRRNRLTSFFVCIVFSIFAGFGYFNHISPDELYFEGQGKTTINFSLKSIPASATVNNYGTENGATIKLFGFLPVKKATVEEIKRPMLVPSGKPFGIKILTDGVIITGFSGFDGIAPAKDAGLKTGDILIKVNNKKVFTNKEVSEAVQENAEKTVLEFKRGEDLQITQATPIEIEGILKIGVWVRDSSAGIGTLTFCNPETSRYGGLGHGICDVDTGKIMPLLTGEAARVSIGSVIKSTTGKAGELCGSFLSTKSIGSIQKNTECGIFGEVKDIDAFGDAEPLPMAFKHEVKLGNATILTTIDGEEPKEYGVSIEQIDFNEKIKVKNIIIRITDPKLLSKTGGIVQGMSGSPLIQDGKLIGAVTHVFTDDTERGFAIFAESMYKLCG